ncbi:50S ribosomal protein L16 [Candidatus Peregrinibacteria bacterium CG10_big_fil_rev_8_21_14_0_10_36_19]|nr:MAG: 50S ribosomal protein L16 [Candidatus Peregrinibacteria bacterium CG10_big_fil_rev_8_21_14_0_10_36_19]
MLQPRKQKYRKVFRDRSALKGLDYRGSKVSFGTFGLKAQSAGEITSRQIEAARRAMTRYVKRGGKIWINIFPHKPITRKASEVPMGSGKGAPDHFVATVRPGRVIFEMEGVDPSIAKEAMRLAAHKLPVKCKFIDINE